MRDLTTLRRAFLGALVFTTIFANSRGVAETAEQIAVEAEHDLVAVCDTLATRLVQYQAEFSDESFVPMLCSTEEKTLSGAVTYLTRSSALRTLTDSASKEDRAELQSAMKQDFSAQVVETFRNLPETGTKKIEGLSKSLFGNRWEVLVVSNGFVSNLVARVAADTLRSFYPAAQGILIEPAKRLGGEVLLKGVTLKGAGAALLKAGAKSGIATLKFVIKSPITAVTTIARSWRTIVKVIKGFLCMSVADYIADLSNDKVKESFLQMANEADQASAQLTNPLAGFGRSEEEKAAFALAEAMRAERYRRWSNNITGISQTAASCLRVASQTCGTLIGYVDLSKLAGAKEGSYLDTTLSVGSFVISGGCWLMTPVGGPLWCGGTYAAAYELKQLLKTGNTDVSQCFGPALVYAVNKSAEKRYSDASLSIDMDVRVVTEKRTGKSMDTTNCCLCRQTFYRYQGRSEAVVGSVNMLEVIEKYEPSKFSRTYCANREKMDTDESWSHWFKSNLGMDANKVVVPLSEPYFDFYRYTDCHPVRVMGENCVFPKDENGKVYDRKIWDENKRAVAERTADIVAPANDLARPVWWKE